MDTSPVRATAAGEASRMELSDGPGPPVRATACSRPRHQTTLAMPAEEESVKWSIACKSMFASYLQAFLEHVS
eukprot:1865140-Rhodomonas_salina.1